MTALLLSTIAFLVANHVIGRYLDEQGIASGMTRRVFTFTAAAAVSYAVAFLVEHLLL